MTPTEPTQVFGRGMSDDTRRIIVGLTVITETPEETAHAAEVLNRTATGLALDGRSVQVNMNTVDDDECCTCDEPCEEGEGSA